MFKLGLIGLAVSAIAFGSMTGVDTKEKEDLNATIIVQVSGDACEMSKDAVIRSQNYVLNQIRNNITTDYIIKDRFTSSLNAFVLHVNSKHVSAIRELDNVFDVNYNNKHKAMSLSGDVSTTKEFSRTQEGENISSNTMNFTESTNEGEGVLIAILDTGYMVNASVNGTTGVTHNAFTDLDVSVDLKVTQDSIQQAISGDDGFHGKKDDAHSTYWNRKVPFYYDYGGEVFSEEDLDFTEDYDVFDPSEPHGNHVASIAAGNDPLYKGVAPKAQLALMKVFTELKDPKFPSKDGVSMGAFNDCIIKAFEDCATLGADIVNLSLGTTLDDFNDSITMNFIKKLQGKGMLINYACGNDGKNFFGGSVYEFWSNDIVEPGILSGEANMNEVMSVGACQGNKEYYDTAFVVGNRTVAFKDQIENYSSDSGEVVYKPERHLTDLLVNHPDGHFKFIKIGGWGEEKDYDGKDCEGKIVIVDRGETTFLEKINTAVSHGAIAVGIINNDPTELDFTFRMDLSGSTPSVPVVSILYKDKVTFDDAKTDECILLMNTEANNPSAKTMTTFSSDGPTFDLNIKPEICAPGQSIAGAIYAKDDDGNYLVDGYEYYNGTSMATPNYCGALAILIGEHLNDEEYFSTVNARTMSTADPMFDVFGVNYDSVRRQGAGLVNIDSALKSKQYLNSSLDLDKLSNHAKIELKNNDDIKKGDVKLSFSLINEEDSNITYNATTYVYRPKLVEMTNENFGEKFLGKELQATYDELIGTVTNTVSVEANSSTVVNLPTYSLSNAEKEYIDSKFDYGCYIEGFVILTAEGKETLSIPFLGFYGDITEAIPVEPFSFEKQADKLYASDLLTGVAQYYGGKTSADFASDWVFGNFNSFDAVDVEQYLLNEKTLRQMVDSNTQSLRPIGINPYTNEIDMDHIYLGNTGAANTMIITQYVMRSVMTNTITITNKATGETILTDHMYDSLFGAIEDDDGNETQWPLYKSWAVADYWESGIIAHEAYTIIPLYDNIEVLDKNGDVDHYEVGEFYPEGEYDITFNYTLTDGTTFTKSYSFTIDNTAPVIDHSERMTVGGKDVIRVYINEEHMSYAVASGKKVLPTLGDDNLYYFDVEVSSLNGKNLLSKAIDMTGATTTALTVVDAGCDLTITNKNMAASLELTTKISDADAKTKDVSIKVKKNGKAFTVNGDILISLKLFENFEDVEKVLVYTGKESQEVDFEIVNGYITFNCSSDLHFAIVNAKDVVTPDPLPPVDPEPENPTTDSNKGCGGSIVAGGSIMSILAALGAALLSKKRKIK